MATMTYSPVLTGATQLRPLPSVPVLRLTRRGRAFLVAVVLLTLIVAAVGLANAVVASSTSQAPALERVVVQPGQSLWGYAAKSMPGVDSREALIRIRELNGLSASATIVPGQVLLVPAHS